MQKRIIDSAIHEFVFKIKREKDTELQRNEKVISHW